MAARHSPSAGGWLVLRYYSNEERYITTVIRYPTEDTIG